MLVRAEQCSAGEWLLTSLDNGDALAEDVSGTGVGVDGADQDDGADERGGCRGEVASYDAPHAVTDDDNIRGDGEGVEQAERIGSDRVDAVSRASVGREAGAVGIEG